MSDTSTTSDQAEAELPPPSPEDRISRGKGVKLDAIAEDTPAFKAVEEFKDLVSRHKVAEAEAEALKEERNAAIYDLKANHNVGFSAIAEIIGATSSLVLYLYERAQGKSAKQIREESMASNRAKQAFRETDPNAKPARKQTPEEKAFRKQQREALAEFLKSQAAANPSDEGASPDDEDDNAGFGEDE